LGKGFFNIVPKTGGAEDLVFLTDWNFNKNRLPLLKMVVLSYSPVNGLSMANMGLANNGRLYTACGRGIIPFGRTGGASIRYIPDAPVTEDSPLYFFITGWGNNNFNVWATTAQI
jgi:hypothetical protein